MQKNPRGMTECVIPNWCQTNEAYPLDAGFSVECWPSSYLAHGNKSFRLAGHTDRFDRSAAVLWRTVRGLEDKDRSSPTQVKDIWNTCNWIQIDTAILHPGLDLGDLGALTTPIQTMPGLARTHLGWPQSLIPRHGLTTGIWSGVLFESHADMRVLYNDNLLPFHSWKPWSKSQPWITLHISSLQKLFTVEDLTCAPCAPCFPGLCPARCCGLGRSSLRPVFHDLVAAKGPRKISSFGHPLGKQLWHCQITCFCFRLALMAQLYRHCWNERWSVLELQKQIQRNAVLRYPGIPKLLIPGWSGCWGFGQWHHTYAADTSAAAQVGPAQAASVAVETAWRGAVHSADLLVLGFDVWH